MNNYDRRTNFKNFALPLILSAVSTLAIYGQAKTIGVQGSVDSSAVLTGPAPGKTDKNATPSPTPIPARSPNDDDKSAQDTSKPIPSSISKPKRGSFIVAPIPISSPTFGGGLILGLGYVFKLNPDDKASPPSTLGMAGVYTASGSRLGAIGGRFYFSENKYQATFLAATGRANFDFYGIGHIAGRSPIVVPMRMGGSAFFGEFMRKVWKDLFVGPRFQYRRLYATLGGRQTPGGFEIPAIDLKSTSAALGFHMQRDLRDSTFYPKKGTLLDIAGNFFAPAFGSRRQYQTYQAAFSGYRQVRDGHVLAYRAMACTANGSVPFYDLCFFGSNSNLRGYTAGEFQNRRMFAAQTEYRIELPKRFGVVMFGGVGGVAGRWNEFRSDQLLPAAGVGLRFNLDKVNHINYRVDVGYGRAGRTLSISVGEAF